MGREEYIYHSRLVLLVQFDHSLYSKLLTTFQCYPNQSYLLAYSGGMDSHVLLHALAHLQSIGKIQQLRAIHIDHGLQAESSAWSNHCKETAGALGVSCEVIPLNLKIPEGESLEAVARDARYDVFKQRLEQGEALLTAHHQNDQAETVLLQLFRGSGVDGLAAMPEVKDFERGMLLRPLLNYSRQFLEDYAKEYQLNYIDDPSNFDTDFDRNFLRHDVLPLLQTHWKGVTKNLTRVARLQAEAKHLLEENAEIDYQAMEREHFTLSIDSLLQLPKVRQKLVIRLWLSKQQFLMPSEIKLEHLISDVLYAKSDAKPCVHWSNVEVRRYQNRLYALQINQTHKADRVIDWDACSPLVLSSITIELDDLGEWKKVLQQADKVTVRFRQGGERIRLRGHKQTVKLKKLLQESNIPPWERDRIPLIYLGEKLIIVYPYWSSDYEIYRKTL